MKKEMYTLHDLSDNELALRPEGTAPAVRAAINAGMLASGIPTKLCYTGPMFR